jgi:hypothetical protein
MRWGAGGGLIPGRRGTAALWSLRTLVRAKGGVSGLDWMRRRTKMKPGRSSVPATSCETRMRSAEGGTAAGAA